MRFAQCIKSTVIKDHACHNIRRPGFLQPFCNITADYLIRIRIVFCPKRRQLIYRQQKHRDERQTKQDRHTVVYSAEPLKSSCLRPFFISLIKLFSSTSLVSLSASYFKNDVSLSKISSYSSYSTRSPTTKRCNFRHHPFS